MSALLALALIAQAFPPLPRPDGFRIAELDYQLGMGACIDYYHSVPCPGRPRLVSDVACTRDVPDTVTCTWQQRDHAADLTDTCRGTFLWREGAWHYPAGAGANPLPPSDAVATPTCSASGSPDAATIAGARLAAYSQLACVRFPADGAWRCPPNNVSVTAVGCYRHDRAAPFSCSYGLSAADAKYVCKADLRSGKMGWTLTGRLSRDGRFSYDEACR